MLMLMVATVTRRSDIEVTLLTSPLADDDELTALYDAEIPRVDLVRGAASGVPRFLLAKQAEDAAGLLDADYVRDLIGKSEPDPEPASLRGR